MKKAVIVGFGGHAKVVLDIIANSDYEFIGYSDLTDKKNGYYYLGNDDRIIENFVNQKNVHIFLGISYTGKDVNLNPRKQIISFYEKHGVEFSSLISKTAIVSRFAKLRGGVFAGNGVIINAGAEIGKNVLLNTGVVVEHDVVLNENVQVAPGTVLLGGAVIGKNTFIGAGSVIRDGINIGNDVIIGAGSIVVKDIKEKGVYFGNPLKRYK